MICSVTPCTGGAVCDSFSRTAPDEQGWSYRGTSPPDPAKFKIDSEPGDACLGRFFASQEFTGSTLGSRIISRKFAVTSGGFDVSFDFTYGGQTDKVVGAARAVFAVVTPDSNFTLSSPYVALALTNDQFVLFGQALNGTPAVSTGVEVPNTPQRVTMHVSVTGSEQSTVKFASKGGSASVEDSLTFPALGTDLKEVNLVLGAAVVNVAASADESVDAYFDNVEVANQ